MVKRQVLPDGRYIVLTTRRHNFTSFIFGKATVYKSKESYDKGNLLTDGWEEITNIFLGNTQADLPGEIEKFIKSLTE